MLGWMDTPGEDTIQREYHTNDQDWIEEAAQRWIDESPVVSNAETVAEKLYLTILSRKPNSEEAALVRGYLVARADEPKTALRDLIWALLSCTEFRFQS